MPSKEGSEVKQAKPKRFGRLVFTVAISLGICYLAFLLIQLNAELVRQKAEQQQLQQQLLAVNNENERLSYYSQDENIDTYIEQIARDELDYAKPGERVIYIVPEENG